jgi:hypothetical protein
MNIITGSLCIVPETTPIPKNRFSLMPAVDHMIPAVQYFQSGMPGHPPPSNQPSSHV